MTENFPQQKKLLPGLPQNPKLLLSLKQDNKSQLTIDHIESPLAYDAANKVPELNKNEKKLPDPSSPLGVDISQLNLSGEEMLIFNQLSDRIGEKLDYRIAKGGQSIKDVEDAIISLQKAKSLEAATPYINFLRKVEDRIDQLAELTTVIKNFTERHPGFSSIEQDVKSIKRSCDNAKTYGGFQYGIEQLPKYKNFCTQYVSLQTTMNARKHLISLQDQEKVILLYQSLKALSFDAMVDTLGKMQLICDSYNTIINEKQSSAEFLQTKTDLISKINSILKTGEITEKQKQQILNQLDDLNNYEKEIKESLQYGFDTIFTDPKLKISQELETKQKQNDLDSLPFDQYIARHDFEKTMKDMNYFEKVIDIILLLPEPSPENHLIDYSDDFISDTTSDEKIFRYAEQASETLLVEEKINESQDKILVPKDDIEKLDEPVKPKLLPQRLNVGQIIPNETKKLDSTPKNTSGRFKKFMSKLIPAGLISALTAVTVAISNPNNLDQSANIAKKPFMPSNEKERMMQSLDEAGLRGQLYQAARQLPGNITSIQQLAEKRADFDKPDLTEAKKQVNAQRFIDGIMIQSPKSMPVNQIFGAVRIENKGKQDIIEKIDKAEQIYNNKD